MSERPIRSNPRRKAGLRGGLVIVALASLTAVIGPAAAQGAVASARPLPFGEFQVSAAATELLDWSFNAHEDSVSCDDGCEGTMYWSGAGSQETSFKVAGQDTTIQEVAGRHPYYQLGYYGPRRKTAGVHVALGHTTNSFSPANCSSPTTYSRKDCGKAVKGSGEWLTIEVFASSKPWGLFMIPGLNFPVEEQCPFGTSEYMTSIDTYGQVGKNTIPLMHFFASPSKLFGLRRGHSLTFRGTVKFPGDIRNWAGPLCTVILNDPLDGGGTGHCEISATLKWSITLKRIGT
jgi:hypothetical protein